MNVQDIVKELDLVPHIEGGYFKEMYASEVSLDGNSIATSIYFLLEAGNFSALHRLSNDEMWFFHSGSPLTIAMIDLEGKAKSIKLGLDLEKGEVPFFTVPKHWIFGSYVDQGYALVSCVVAPGFTYEDFELFNRDDLLNEYPDHGELIHKLTR